MMVTGLISLGLPSMFQGRILYKSYIIQKDQGREILCDPYIVRKNDHIWKILRQKGEFATRDFTEFLNVFKRLNPQISDIDRIHPGLQILIPLKILSPGAFKDQATGTVTIPFITVPSVHKILKPFLRAYVVKKGDVVSELVRPGFGSIQDRAYQGGLKLFKLVNPDIHNLNRIYQGQKIYLINPQIQSQPWYHTLFDAAGNIVDDFRFKTRISATSVTPPKERQSRTKSALERLAAVVNAKVVNRGAFFFPQKSGQDLKIELRHNPLLKIDNEKMILFASETLTVSELNLIRSFWKNVKVVSASQNPSMEDMLKHIRGFQKSADDPPKLSVSDDGLELEIRAQWIIDQDSQLKPTKQRICITIVEDLAECTSPAITLYLKSQGIIIKEILRGSGIAQMKYQGISKEPSKGSKAIHLDTAASERLVREVVQALGYRYTPDVDITFPYSGMQVTARSNLITKGDKNLCIDYGDLYGEAASAIRASGLNIIQIKANEEFNTILLKLLKALN
ncbi:MAG: hypothetical protein H8D61_00900, partial [Deltaproteobacteria bacterium]|nr:hypothetical protein [Deltaproteobacteria bacterium]